MWDRIVREATEHLQTLIRIDTTNPPGRETPAATYVASVLGKEALETAVLEYEPGRGSAVARLPGRGSEPPLLLMAHLDVVPARPEEWLHPPFGGELHDGYVWGRGAVDTKNATVIQMMAMLMIARGNISLRRDLLLAAMADEEVGGGGAAFLAAEHPEWVRAEYAINEGGGEALVVGGKHFYAFQQAQKGGLNVRLVGRGTAGHSSVPYPQGAISRLASAIVRLKGRELPHHVTDTTRRFFEGMADALEEGRPELARACRSMLDAERQPSAVRELGLDGYTERTFSAMMRNVAEPTMLNAGYKANVMPASAEALVSARPLPGIAEDELMAEIRAAVGDTVDAYADGFAAGLEFNLPDDDPLLLATRRAIGRRDPTGVVLPYLSCGGTDAAYLAPLGTQVVGFTPMRPDPAGSLLQLAHSSNERISTDNLLFGVQVLFDVICDLNGVDPGTC